MARLHVFFLALLALAQSPTYKVGDRVEAHDVGWYKGAVTIVGTGTNQGQYFVKYDDFSIGRYFSPADLRPGGPPAAAVTAKAPVPASTTGPRPGKYNIYSYGAVAANPLYLGHLEILPGGQYRVSRTSAGPYYGEGTFRFNTAANAVEWLTGPYATPDWAGKFSEEAGRHRIALRARTIATNSP